MTLLPNTPATAPAAVGRPGGHVTEQEFAVFADALTNGEFGTFPVSG